nr:metalloregulator ArsR/SmtB family transcription factor [Sulfobacillus harzensis]
MLPGVFLIRSPVFELLASMFRLQSHEHLSKTPAALTLADFDVDLFVDRTRKSLPQPVLEGLKVFFNEESYLGLSLVSFAWVQSAWQSVEIFMDRLSQMSPRELFRSLLSTGYSPDGPLNIDDPESVRDYINRTNLPDLEKWKLSYLYLNAESAKQQFIDLVAQCHERYFAAEWERLQKLQDESMARVAERVHSHRDLMNEFPILNGVPIDNGGVEVVLAPSVFYHLDSLSSFSDERLLFIALYGIHYLGRKSMRSDEMAGFLKVLSDETRIKIIKTLAVTPCFGYELAQRLGLSNSTISHHLAILADMGLVVPDRQENRVYYTLDRQRLGALLASLDRQLLG